MARIPAEPRRESLHTDGHAVVLHVESGELFLPRLHSPVKVRRNESRVIINVTEKCRTLFNDEVYFFPGSHVQKLIVYMGNAAFYKNAYTHLVTDAVINHSRINRSKDKQAVLLADCVNEDPLPNLIVIVFYSRFYSIVPDMRCFTARI